MKNKFRLIPKVMQYRLAREINCRPPLPINITVSVTYRCNSHCSICNIWKKKKTDEFSLDEFEKTFGSLGTVPYMFVMSGGEPLIRDDIVEICLSAYNHCKPGIITIPTNGILCGRIPKKAAEIAESCPSTQIIINLSLDGIGQKHDEIRGVKGNFEKAMKTYQDLKALDYPNLEVGVHSVISRFNVKNIPEIYQYLQHINNNKSFTYTTQIAEERVELDTIGKNISPEYEEYVPTIDFLVDELRKGKSTGFSKIAEDFRLEYYKLIKTILAEKRQVIPCYAGFASAHIAPNGDIWQCCNKAESIGNLREAEYDFMRVWDGYKAKLARHESRKGGCYCTMLNASYTNMLCNPRTILRLGIKILFNVPIDKEYPIMTIRIIGSKGFKGSHLVKAFAMQGHQMSVSEI